MKYVKKNPAKKSQTRMIAVLLVAVSVLSIGAGAAAMKFVSVKKDACAPLAADQVQTMALNADNQNTQMITAVEMTAAQNKSPMQLEAEKWFSPAELKTIAEADLAKMVQQRKEEYGKYLNAEEMKLTYAEKNFLYNKRTAEEAAKKQADAQMVLDITDMTMGIGDKVTLKAALLPAAKNATYIWQINDTSIATLTPNGDSAVITAKAAGTTTVTVSNGKSKETCIVRVKAAESFYLNTGSKTLVEGDYYTATASSKIASVKSSNNSVATVSFDGTKAYISAKNPGAATITVTGKNGKSATMAVTVEAYGLTLNKNQMNLTVGEWKDLYVTFGHTPTETIPKFV